MKLILVPNEIFNESVSGDPFQRDLMISYLENEIETMKIYHGYVYESSLLEVSNDVFIEAGNPDAVKVKKENIFVRAVKGILGAINKLFTSLRDAVVNAFGKKENITPEDYFDSPQGKIRLEADVNELERIASDEIRKGNKLIQKISSATGIDDSVIDDWLAQAGTAMKNALPVVVPAVLTFGFRKVIKKGIDKMQNDVTNFIGRHVALKAGDPFQGQLSTNGGNSNTGGNSSNNAGNQKQQRQKLKVFAGFQKIINDYTTKAMGVLHNIASHKKKSNP